MRGQTLRAVQRVAAYALLPDQAGAPYLVRASAAGAAGPWWSLPGGQVRHGEPPAHTAVRAVRNVTGADVEVTGVREVLADVVELADRGLSVHTVRIVYDARVTTVPGRRSGDAVPVRVPELAEMPLLSFTASALGLTTAGSPRPVGKVDPLPEAGEPGASTGELGASTGELGASTGELGASTGEPGASAGEPGTLVTAGGPRAPRVQRTGSYGLVVQDDRVLLSRYVRDGRWSLPGGGIDHGEQPVQALCREVHEETGLVLDGQRLIDVDSVHVTGRSPHGKLEDFHAVRIVYVGVVRDGGRPRVLEVDGTTDAAAWVPLDGLGRLPVTQLVYRALQHAR